MAGRRLAIVIENAQCDGDRRFTLEENRYFATESEILSPLAHVESKSRFALARVSAVEERYAVFEREAAERRAERRFIVGEYAEPAIAE